MFKTYSKAGFKKIKISYLNKNIAISINIHAKINIEK